MTVHPELEGRRHPFLASKGQHNQPQEQRRRRCLEGCRQDEEQEVTLPHHRKGRSESKSSFHLTDGVVDLPERASSPSEMANEDFTPKATKVLLKPPSEKRTAAAIIDSSSDDKVATQPVAKHISVVRVRVTH